MDSRLKRASSVRVSLVVLGMLAAVLSTSAGAAVDVAVTEERRTNQVAWRGTNLQVQNEIVGEIARVGAGDALRVSIFAMDDGSPMKDALVAALGRGVDVRLLTEATAYNDRPSQRQFVEDLYAAGGTFEARACASGCESTGTGVGAGINHEKLIYATMSGARSGWDVDSSDDFAIASSANWADPGGAPRFEAAMMFNTDSYPAIGSFIRDRFDDMWGYGEPITVTNGEVVNPVPLKSGGTAAAYDGYKAVYSGSGNAGVIDWGANLGASVLKWEDFINDATGGGCVIRIVMGSWDQSGPANGVIDALRRAKYRGCDVDAIFNAEEVPGKAIITRARATASGVEKPFEIELQWRDGEAHAKFLTIAHNGADSRTWIGSANVVAAVMRKNDEITMRSENTAIYDFMVDYFDIIESEEGGSGTACQQPSHFDDPTRCPGLLRIHSWDGYFPTQEFETTWPGWDQIIPGDFDGDGVVSETIIGFVEDSLLGRLFPHSGVRDDVAGLGSDHPRHLGLSCSPSHRCRRCVGRFSAAGARPMGILAVGSHSR